jgi:hypothetical protein
MLVVLPLKTVKFAVLLIFGPEVVAGTFSVTFCHTTQHHLTKCCKNEVVPVLK